MFRAAATIQKLFTSAWMGILVGLLLGLALIPDAITARPSVDPTFVTWTGGSCKAPIGTVTVTATSFATGEQQVKTFVGVDLTRDFGVSFESLHQAQWSLRPVITYAGGESPEYGTTQVVVGRGDALPNPEPTPTPTPAPTPTPTPTPEPGQEIPAVDFTRYTTGDQWVRVPGGNAYSFAECCGWMMVRKPGVTDNYLLPGAGPEPGAWGREFTFVNGALVVFDSREQYNKWYIIRADHTGLTPYNGTGEAPTQGPTPTPTPVDLSPVLSELTFLRGETVDARNDIAELKLELSAQRAIAESLMASVEKLLQGAQPRPTCEVLIASVQSPYANGDQRLTVRWPVACGVALRDQRWEVIKR